MHCILSLLKHVSRKNEGRRVGTADPAPKSSLDHPLEREKDGHQTGGSGSGVPKVGFGGWEVPSKKEGGEVPFASIEESGERILSALSQAKAFTLCPVISPPTAKRCNCVIKER